MNRMILLGGAAVVAIAAGAFVVMQQRGGDDPLQETALSPEASQPETETAEAPDTSGIVEMTLGDPNAPITMVEYASYTCPHCATFHAGPFKQIKENYIDTGKVHFIYREVYFDRYGIWASLVARCAGPDRFFGINDLIYASQSEWTRAGEPVAIADELRKIGRLAGIENEQLESCLADGEKAQALVAWYQENAARDNVTGTPSFVVDGRSVPNQSYSAFVELFDGKLGQ